MATKKPMKKFKRYDDGGEVMGSMDSKEAADKQRGLELSNKEGPVGFFERIRMGNIDDPSSEAYKRFGAGRGRAAPAVEEERPMPVARPPAQPNPMIAAGIEQGKRQPSGDASVAEDYSGPRTTPIVPTPVKPAASKPAAPSMRVPPLSTAGPNRSDLANKPSQYAGPMRGQRSDAGTSPPVQSSGRRYESTSPANKMDVSGMRDSAKAALSDDPTALIGGAGAAAAALLARSKLGKMFRGAKKAADKSPYLKEIGMEPKKLTGSKRTDSESKKADKAYDKLKNSKFTKKSDDDVTDVTAKKRGGMVKKYASGGMVSSASKRADGIATKGKTRCKIC
jgi:hypothetical protein